MSRAMKIMERAIKSFEDTLFVSLVPKHTQAVRSFQREVYSANAYQQSERFNDWLYEEGPGRFLYSFDDEQVVGQQGGYKFNIEVCGQVVKCAYAFDLYVKEQYRLRGLGVALTAFHSKQQDVTVGLGISDDAVAMYKRMGWVNMGRLDYAVLFLGIPSIHVRWRGTGNLSVRPFLKLLFVILKVIQGQLQQLFTRHGSTIRTFQMFDESLYELYQNNQNAMIAPQRSVSDLNWKYGHKHYKRYLIHLDSGTEHIVVLREEVSEGSRKWFICEYPATESVATEVLVAIKQLALKNKVEKVIFQGCNQGWMPKLVKSGYVTRNYGARWMFYCDDERLRNTLSNRSDWHIGAAESDLDFHCMFD